MSDRELIGQAIDTWFEGSGLDPELDPEQLDSLASKILAAIGDRLLPPLPEWCSTVYITMDHKDAAFDAIGSGKTYLDAHSDCIADAEPALLDIALHPEDYE